MIELKKLEHINGVKNDNYQIVYEPKINKELFIINHKTNKKILSIDIKNISKMSFYDILFILGFDILILDDLREGSEYYKECMELLINFTV